MYQTRSATDCSDKMDLLYCTRSEKQNSIEQKNGEKRQLSRNDAPLDFENLPLGSLNSADSFLQHDWQISQTIFFLLSLCFTP